ncbi:hypothetical protein [Luteibacter sp. 9135]|uniref:hypothetical protein n=1 Tax=Luteibacter sp. 9135 TaxID=1500893 RepID=UPI00056AA009|nr:hypothetical protein [Luteibacter sp. 9135]
MIGILLLMATLVAIVATRRSPSLWAGGALLGTGIGVVAVLTGLVGLAGLLNLAGVGAVISTGVDLATPRLKQRLPFDATHAHDHLALNEHSGQLWVRDISGKEVIVRKSEVQEWIHRYVANGQYKARNAIELRLTSLDLPTVTAKFNRHPDTVWGAPKNAAEAQEWFARLSAFLRS